MRKIVLFSCAVMLVTGSGVFGYYLYKYQTKNSTSVTKTVTIESPIKYESVIGTSRPNFQLPDVSGSLRSIAEWDGQVVALNFWATWCPPCIKEIPDFIRLQSKYADQGLQFIGIALQRPEDVIEFIATYGVNYPVLAGELEVISVAKSYGNHIGALPYTVFIDREGLISYVKRGPLDAEIAEDVIISLL